MADTRKPTPPGTGPLLISGALLLLLVPAVLLGRVVPQWLSILGAFLFLAVAVAALVWTYRTYSAHRGTPARGVSMAGLVLGVIVVVVAGLVLVPYAMG
jgi:heme A synthase